MLILSRRVGEALQIGEEVQVVTLAIHGNQVRLGIEAPRDVVIIRNETQQYPIKWGCEAPRPRWVPRECGGNCCCHAVKGAANVQKDD